MKVNLSMLNIKEKRLIYSLYNRLVEADAHSRCPSTTIDSQKIVQENITEAIQIMDELFNI